MKKELNLFVFIFLVLILSSCEYSPSEIPLTELEKPSETAPGIWIDLKPEMDTLKLTSATNVTYNVEAGDRNIYRIEIFLDDVQSPIYFASQNSVYTEVPVYMMSDGLHELKIRTFTSTNSGSIADKLQAEQYLYELTWPVFVDKQAKNNCKILKTESADEGVNVVWNKYDFADFPGYRLNKYSEITRQNIELLNTKDPHHHSVIDRTYIEGDYVQYSLTLDGVAYDFKYFYEDIKRPTVKVNSDFTFDASWIPSKYPQNVKSYFLKTTIPQFGYPEDHEVTDLNQTTVRFSEKIGFGGNYGVQLRYIPRGFDSYKTFDVAGGLTNIGVGDSIPAFERGFLIYGTNSMLLYNNGTFSKYNYVTGISSDSFSITPIETVYQRFIVSSTNGSLFGYFQNQEFIIRRSKDCSLLNKMNIGTMENFYPSGNNISISDDGKVAVIDIYNNLQIFDFKTGLKIAVPKFESQYVPVQVAFSPEGKGISVRVKNYMEQKSLLITYTIESNGLNKVNEFVQSNSSYESTFSYSPVDGKIIYLDYGGMYNYTVQIINAQTLIVENSVKIPQFFVPVAYDYETNQVIAQFQSFPTERYSYLIDVKSKKLTKVIQFVARNHLLFSNGTVFSGNGRSIKIDDYILQ